MLDDLAVLESSIPQQSYIRLLGFTLREHNNLVKAVTPVGSVTLYSDSFVCDEPNSPVLFGGYLDLIILSLMRSLKNRDRLFRNAIEQALSLEELTEEFNIEELTEDLRWRRTGYDAIRRCLQGVDNTLAAAAGWEYLRKQRLTSVSGAVVVTKKEASYMGWLFNTSELNCMFEGTDWFPAVTIWDSPGSFVGFHSLRNPSLNIALSNKSLNGLTGDPRHFNVVKEIPIVENLASFETGSKVFINTPNASCKFEDLIVREWTNSIDQIRKLLVFPGIKVQEDDDRCIDLKDKVLQEYIAAPSYNENKLLLCCSNRSNRDYIIDRLREEGNLGMIKKIKQSIPDEVLLKDKNRLLVSRPAGYFMLSGEEEKRLTNFTADIDSVTIFKDTSDIFIDLRVFTSNTPDGLVIPINIDDFNSVTKFQTALRKSWVGVSTGVEHVPRVIEVGSAGKLFVSHLQSKIEDSDHVLGVSQLGWNKDRTAFSGPFFEVNEKETRMLKRKLHPAHTVFNHFSSEGRTTGSLVSKLPVSVTDLLSQIVAIICRHKAGYTIRPISVLNCRASQLALKTIFAGLGQTSPVVLNANARQGTELPGINGYPVYGLGYTPGQVQSSKLPAFILVDDRSFPICADVSEEDLQVASFLLPTLVTNAVRYLLLNGTDSYERIRSIEYSHELKQEGAKIISESSDLGDWAVSEMPYINFENMLRNIPFSETSQYFDYDFQNQIIRLHFSRLTLENVNTSDLVVELSSLMNKITVGDGYVDMDAMSAGSILQDFYQNIIDYNMLETLPKKEQSL